MGIIATDGLPSDDWGTSGDLQKIEFVNVLKGLEGLPIWIVIRLCTSDHRVVDFYNDLDAQLELSIEVLDDYESEASEIYKHNYWFNYTYTMHRAREMGYTHRLFDLMDERRFTKDEVEIFCKLLFGREEFDDVPSAEEDWKGFHVGLENIIERHEKQWNPMKRRKAKLLSVRQLDKIYHPSDEMCAIM